MLVNKTLTSSPWTISTDYPDGLPLKNTILDEYYWKNCYLHTYVTFRFQLNLNFKSRLNAKYLLWKSVFIHIEIETNYQGPVPERCNSFIPRINVPYLVIYLWHKAHLSLELSYYTFQEPAPEQQLRT